MYPALSERHTIFQMCKAMTT
ncbi:hypothetical protein EYZ11_002905 [Aspergillus tanneri]|uniref:Uncharacterized protein n=1 Tax=Aspergillus tanneri TaxID=1220188 RepID=A0A4S3JPT8_9EURO|nr:hypothetical protein EYZ11_002905 [Aspergillus tanneri]